MMTERLINALVEIGFSRNEAKIYAVLLEEAPTTGYTAALRSGVTKARAYDTLEQMADKGFVYRLSGSPTLFRPRPIEEIVDEQNAHDAQKSKAAAAAMSKIQSSHPSHGSVVSIVGYNTIMRNIKAAIEKANERVDILIRREEFAFLGEALHGAAGRGVAVYAVLAVDSMDEIDASFSSDVVYVNRLHSTSARGGNRWLPVAIDRKTGFIGMVSHGERSIAVETRNPGYTMIIQNNISTYFVQRDVLQQFPSCRFISPEKSKYQKFREKLAEFD